MKKLGKKVLVVVCSLSLLLPAVFGITGWAKEKKLDGAIYLSTDNEFSWKGWWDGTWQIGKENFLNDHFWGRNFCVRVSNEIDFRMFKTGHANGVVIGKENYLYERDYILTYYGKDFMGDDLLNGFSDKILKAQQILQKMNKHLIVVLAAGKGSFYPEYFPDSFKKLTIGPTNYETLSKQFVNKNVNFIDFSTHFRNLKGTTPYLLYPKYGVHWSYYGSAIAQDSIVKYIEKLSQKRLPHLKYDQIKTVKAYDIDYDIGAGMNMLSYLDGPMMGDPQLYTENQKADSMLSLIVVSDSFYWTIYNKGFSQLFNRSHFWYYNNEIYPEQFTAETLVKNCNFEKEINDHDVFILMATEHNIPGVGWGFVDQIISTYPN